MRSGPGAGLSLAGIGVGIITYAAAQLNIELPEPALILLVIAAAVLILCGILLERAARRAANYQLPDVGIHARQTGTGSVSGNIISDSTINMAATPQGQDKSADPFRRAVANVETELERALGHIDDAAESGLYRRRFPSPGGHRYQALVEQLADRGLSGERRQLSEVYLQLERLNSRMSDRKWSGGPIPEMTIPDVREDDHLDEVKKGIERSLGVLDSLRTRFESDVPARPQTWEEVSRRYATWAELAESGQTYGDIANTRVPLHRDIGEEVVAMIDEIRTNVFTGTSYATYIDWLDRASTFIETVLGPVEREQFRGQVKAPTIDAAVDLHIERLRNLLGRLPSLTLRIEAGQLRQAIQKRHESSRPAFVTMRQ